MRHKVFFLLILVFSLLGTTVLAKEKRDAAKSGQWTLQDTVSAAIGYSPAVKREKESVTMQKESVRQAKAGHLPKVDVEASGGAATLPVSRYD